MTPDKYRERHHKCSMCQYLELKKVRIYTIIVMQRVSMSIQLGSYFQQECFANYINQ